MNTNITLGIPSQNCHAELVSASNEIENGVWGYEANVPGNDESRFSSFEDLVEWVSHEREGILHGHLFYDTHLVAFAPPLLTVRLSPKAPKNLGQQLEILLKKKKNETWTIAISEEIGHPTLHEKEETIREDRHNAILQEPLVKMIIEAFPGATLVDSHNR